MKTAIKITLYKLGWRRTLPAQFINGIPIRDNGEALINIREDERFFFCDDLLARDKVLLRESVAKKLSCTAEILPVGLRLKIYSAYRSIAEQTEMWNEAYKSAKAQFPDLPESDLLNCVRAVCSDPRNGFGGHQTSGAVDVTLCDENGVELDMGTFCQELSSDKTRTNSPEINETQRKNRTVLLNAMTRSGFVNYPNEWWHFCYGDRMWAAYSNKKSADYGLIE